MTAVQRNILKAVDDLGAGVTVHRIWLSGVHVSLGRLSLMLDELEYEGWVRSQIEDRGDRPAGITSWRGGKRMPDPTCPFCGTSLKRKTSTRNGKCRSCGRGIPPTRCAPDPRWQARKVTITEQAWVKR